MTDQSLFNIIVCSHHFVINKIEARAKPIILEFTKKFIQWGWIRKNGFNRREPLKVFAASNSERSEYRMHKNCLPQFLEHLKNNRITENLYTITHRPLYVPAVAQHKVKSIWTPRDYQIPYIDYLTQTTPLSKLVGIQTGKGKTATALFSVEKIAQRLMIIVKPAYMDKWVEDVKKTYEIDDEKILVIQGGKQLMAFLSDAKYDLVEAEVIIVSNTTLQGYLTAYERFGDEIEDIGYDLKPDEMFEKAKIGVRLFDEVHQQFHLFFKLDLYTHVPCSISLSATLISEDPFISDMYKLMFPINERAKDLELHKYIDSYAVHFQLKKPDKVRTSEYGNTSYSHNAFEESLMRHAPTLKNYLDLITGVFDMSYLKVKREKKRCLIFAYTKEMCTYIVDHLKSLYPEFDIRRYIGEDPWENITDSQVCVSTLGSSGTAIDIPDLTTVILTTAVSSIKSNIQSLGRLRELPDKHDVEFYYFVCEDIQKHNDYHNDKKKMLLERARSFRDILTGMTI